MNKKLICTTSALLITASMAACGKVPAEPETIPTTEATAPVENVTEATRPVITFEETTLVDNEDITFKITAIQEDTLLGYTLKAYLENKTDQDLTFSFSETSVNGYMCDPLWASTVTAGMKANESISFSSDSFARNGITTVTDIAFKLDIYDSNDWNADHLVSEVFCLYPMGEDAAFLYPREVQENDIVLFENDHCALIITGTDSENPWGYALNVYLQNKTDKTLMFSITDAAVNGVMCDPMWAQTVAPGKASNTSITWFTSSLEEAGIHQVENLSLPIRVYDANNWMAEDILSDTFTFTP